MPEHDEHDETWCGDDVDDNDPKLAVDMATQAFLDYLLDLADESKISDPETCWCAPKAGMSDDGSGEDVSARQKCFAKIISTVPASDSLFSKNSSSCITRPLPCVVKFCAWHGTTRGASHS